MTKETLDSHKVNYLIWRYLLESDYTETAAKLQKEWNIIDPEQLPFAPHVTNHALVSILNRGLLYNVQERECTQPQRDVAGTATGFFGPLTLPDSPAADEDFENARKRQHDNEQPQNQNGPPIKKPRLSNGYENGNGFESSAMDIDEDANADEHAYPSPEQVPSPVVITVGPEAGTQVEKVNELAPETVFLELSEDSTSRSTVLLQCEFNPRDPMILAAAGTDALARMWTLSRNIPNAGSDSPGKPMFAPHHNLLEDSTPASTTTTSIAWSSDGLMIAVSSEPNDGSGSAKIEFWQLDGTLHASFHAFDSPVICLRWNHSNTACLSLSPYEESKGTQVSVMYPHTGARVQTVINHSLHPDQVFDAAWTSDEEFVVCGGDTLQAFHCDMNGIAPGKRFDIREGYQLSRIAYDKRSRLLATSCDSGIIDIWDQSGHLQSFNAHQGLVTSLVWQPVQGEIALGDESEVLLASAGEDCAISIWNARSSDPKSKSSMTMASSVVALSFTPDGAFIAGGTNSNVFIWKVADVNLPRATWTRGDDVGWRTPQSQVSVDEDQFSMSWDADGQKIAYGVNSRLAVINFRR